MTAVKPKCTRLTMGHRPDGSLVRVRFYYKNQEDLADQVAQYRLKNLDTESYDVSSEITFGSYADYWLENFCQKKSPAMMLLYRNSLAKCRENLYPMPLAAIGTRELQKVINDNWEHPRVCQQIKLTLNAILTQAIAENRLQDNFTEHLTIPKYIPSERRDLTAEEKKAIESADFTPLEHFYVNLLYTYGLRIGESIALTKDSFDLKYRILAIDKAIAFDKNTPILKCTKTGKARKLPLTDSIIEEYLTIASVMPQNQTFIFSKENGQPLTQSANRKFQRRYLGKINIALGGDSENDMLNGLTGYTFRHNRTSELIYEGFMQSKLSIKKIAYLMGNSEAMVMKVYSHIQEEKEHTEELYKSFTL